MRAVLERVSPLTYADRVKMPLFIAHDKNDTAVPYSESEQMVASVRKSGTPVWFMSATDQGHGITRASSLTFLTNAWVYFMQEYLIK